MDLDAVFGDGEEEEELYQYQSWYMMLSFSLWNAFDTFIFNTRNPPVDVQRLDWAEHVDRQIQRGTFNRMYRMSVDAFNELVELLREALLVDERMANIWPAAGMIIPEIRLHCLIRYVAGGSYLDISAMVNIHHSTFTTLFGPLAKQSTHAMGSDFISLRCSPSCSEHQKDSNQSQLKV